MGYLLVNYIINFAGVALLIYAGYWVWRDVKNFNKLGIKTISPDTWFLLIILFLPVFLPLYLLLKSKKYNKLLEKINNK